MNGKDWSAWRKKRRFQLQLAALVIGLLAPFGLYLGLGNDNPALALTAFVLLVVSMLLALWAG